MSDILKAIKGATVTFDPTRCNHMGKTASECLPCLHQQIAALEAQLAEARRREKLLRAHKTGMDMANDWLRGYRSAIDGGALEDGEE